MEMKYLKTFESFNSEEVNENWLSNKAKQLKAAVKDVVKDKTPEKIALAFAEAQKGVLTEDLMKAYQKLKEQDSDFPRGVISGTVAPNMYAAIDKNIDKNHKIISKDFVPNPEEMKKITEIEIAKVFFQSKQLKKVDGEWEGAGKGPSGGATGAQGAYGGN